MKSLETTVLFQEIMAGNDKEFASLKNNRQKIQYIVKTLGLPRIRDEVYKTAESYRSSHGKSLERSMKFLNEGQMSHNKREYDYAIHCYTQALLNTPFSKKEKYHLSECYALRSISFYESAEYENALFDASLSLELFPTEIMFFQKVCCLRFLGKFTKAIELLENKIQMAFNGEIKFSVYAIDSLKRFRNIIVKEFQRNNYMENEDEIQNEKFSQNFWIHPSLHLEFTPKKGRHYITKEFIPKNTTIIVEKSYNVVLFGENKINHCLNCNEFIGYKTYPCVGCNEAVFCSPSCCEEAMDRYHRFECGIVGLMLSISSANLQVFRMFAEFGCLKAFNSERIVKEKGFDINQYLKNVRNQTIERKYQTLTEKILEFKAYATLVDHNDEFDVQRNSWQTFCSIESVVLLEYGNALGFNILENINGFIAMTDVFIVNTRRVLCNVFGGFVYSGMDRKHVTNGHCFVASLMNHSCDPNTEWNFDNKNITFKTKRDIKAGEEVTDTYGPSKFSPLFERQQRLKGCYHFTCDCTACLSDAEHVPALQCRQCDGPVIYSLSTKESLDSCLKCGHSYENIGNIVKGIEEVRVVFEDMIRNLENYREIEKSLDILIETFEIIFGLLYQKSNILTDIMRKFFIACNCFDRNLEAIDYCEYLLKENNPLREEFLYDLMLCSNIYYKYLVNGSQISTEEEWIKGFELYSELTENLNQLKKYSKDLKNTENQYQFYAQHLERTTVEFNQLIHIYHNQ